MSRIRTKPLKLFTLTIFSALTLEIFTSSTLADETCKKWFESSHLTPGDKECLLKCKTLKVDLGTFDCPDQCDLLCQIPKHEKCDERRNRLSKLLVSGRPKGWEGQKEKSKAWSKDERSKVIDALTEMPDLLLNSGQPQFYRMETSRFSGNSASRLKDAIVLYDNAFGANLTRVIYHELVHIYFSNLDFDDVHRYATAANWRSSGPDMAGEKWIPLRSEKSFVESDGMDSIDEDFANNVEYLAFDPAKLKKLTPSLYNWLVGFLGDKLKLGGVCGKK